MARQTFTRPRGKGTCAGAAAVALLALAALACARTNYVSTSGAPPYWACATSTPVPPDEYLVTPTPYGPPQWATTEPEPTATPFYRIGEFYAGQNATVGALQVRLVSLVPQDGYTLSRFVVTNRAGAETAAPLSLMVFGLGPQGQAQGYDPDSQARAELPKASDVEARPIAPGGEMDETLAITGTHTRVGLGVNLLASAGGGGQPLWFNGGADSVPCPNGEAAWPAQAPRPAGYGYTGGPLSAPQPDVVGGPVPVANWVRISTPFGCNPWNGEYTGWCPGDAPFYHAGIDLSANLGEPIYTPIAGTVQFAGWNFGGYGYLVIVRAELAEGDYLFMYFGHMMEPPLVLAGDLVHCGQNIGFVGSTGHSTGPHLHWETRRGTNADDPRVSYYLVSPEDTRPLWPVLCREG
jgi:murein DD-endopeptidase MepM/ murein hydrolase activator NlpD